MSCVQNTAVTVTWTSAPAPSIGGAPDVASLVSTVKPVVVNITKSVSAAKKS